MSSIFTSLTGGSDGGGAGLNFRAKSAPIVEAATKQQADEQYQNVQDALQRQKSFLEAVQAQNGLQNQTNTFNQLQGVANGTGPNPAQAMLNNATGANVANQAALMAGQRGSAANAGLMARQAAQQGANIQQNAAGQGAALQANQSLGALNQMGGLSTAQANQQAQATGALTNATQGEQGNILNAINGLNTNNVAMQGNMNATNAGVSGVAAGQQGNMASNIMGGIGSAFQMIPEAASKGADFLGNLFSSGGGDAASAGGGAMGNIGSGMSAAIAEGGFVDEAPKIPVPGVTQSGVTQTGQASVTGPQSSFGNFLNNQDPQIAPGSRAPPPDKVNLLGEFGNMTKSILPAAGNVVGGAIGSFYGGPAGGFAGGQAGKAVGKGVADIIPEYKAPEKEYYAKGGKVPALVSPGEQYLPPKDVKKVTEGKANPLKSGEKIPGKPVVDGAVNSYANDIVPKKLEAGGIVIPRSITESKNAEAKAKAFVEAHFAQRRKPLKKK